MTATLPNPARPEQKCIRPQPGPQTRFLASPADITIYGGAAGGGKSWGLLLEPVRHKAVPGFTCTIFRRSYPQIMQQGGLWDQSLRVYPLAGARPRKHDLSWDFGTGSSIRFAHLQHSDSYLDWHGAEIALLGFDELTLFEEKQFWYLLSRNRSISGVRPYVRATTNADADSWVAQLIAWWIDQETGLPIPERSGVLRWFIRYNEELLWADSREELLALHPEMPPKSLTFIPAKLSDNQILMATDPGYLANLLAMPLVERERLLGGNWKIKPSAGKVFNRDWFKIVEAAPVGLSQCRYWDKAGTEGEGAFTAGVLMGRDIEGRYFVLDVIRDQWSSGRRNEVIRQTAQLDGYGVEVWVEQEPGSGGKESAEISIRELAGWNVHAERVTGDKVSRSAAFSAQCEARNVCLLNNPNRNWIGPFLDELHAFPTGKFKDQVDAASGAFNKLAMMACGPWDVPSNAADLPAGQRSATADAPSGVFLDPPAGAW
jgi:predicted phage terminase large subunit-like protein